MTIVALAYFCVFFAILYVAGWAISRVVAPIVRIISHGHH